MPDSPAPPRILLQTVGTGKDPNPDENDPGNPVWEALAFTVREVQPDRLVQFCSEYTKRETIPKFDKRIAAPKFQREILCSEDKEHEHDKVGELTFKYGEWIDRLRERHPGAEFHADFTSGTKAMSAALVSAALSRAIPHVHYATGPRDDSGRVTRTAALEHLPTADHLAERRLEELGRLFNHGQFGAVQEQAEALVNTVTRPQLKSRVETLARLAQVYKLWDRFKWNEASLQLTELITNERLRAQSIDAGWDVILLTSQRDHVIACIPKKPTRERVADLLANVDRRLARQQYDDAVSRLYRLTELFLQERFVQRIMPERRKTSNPTNAVPKDVLQRHAPRAAELFFDPDADAKETRNFGAACVIQILAEAGDPVAEQMWDNYTGGTGRHNPKTNGSLFKQMEMRNNSWLAHGSTPADEADSLAFRSSVEGYLADHFQHPPTERMEPLDLPGYLQQIGFARCPWTKPEPI